MIDMKRSGRPSKKPSEGELAIMYASKTTKEIAEYYGVAESTVRRWISDFLKTDK